MNKILPFLILFFVSISLNAQIWEPISDTPFKGDHTLSFGLNGLGYSVGGNNAQGNPSNRFYSYDPTLDIWSEMNDFPGSSRGFGISDTYEGKAYIGFGLNSFNEILRDLWEFDPNTNGWTQLASCPCTPRFHPAFVAHKGKIFVGMGGSANGNLNDWWEYDIDSDTWSQKPSLPGAVRHHPYQFAIGDYVYTGFGHGNGPGLNIYKDWYRYDPVTEEWTQMSDLPSEGRVAGTQFSLGDKGYVLSGDGDNHSFMTTGEFWEYDPIVDTWTSLPPHPGTSRWAPSSFLLDGYVYFLTGLSQSLVEDFRAYRYLLDDNPPTSTDDLAKNELLVSPNPANEIVKVQLKETSSNIHGVSLFNVNGKLFIEKDNLNNNTITLNIQDLPVGVYFLKVELENEVISKKLVKQ